MNNQQWKNRKNKANSILLVNLERVAYNFNVLKKKLGNVECAATLKANAYGVGAGKIAKTLIREGCSTFFLATIDEAIELRKEISSTNPRIIVLNGVPRGTESTFREYQLIPTLNDLDQVNRWYDHNKESRVVQPAILHLDTGMNRLGLCEDDLNCLTTSPSKIKAIGLSLIMSHLACSDDLGNKKNEEQLSTFLSMLKFFPGVKASLSNSGGIFLGTPFHFDVARPGIALYGSIPGYEKNNPLKHAISLFAKILQIRDVRRGMTIGYGATHKVKKSTRIATVGVGYADGYQRSLSSKSSIFFRNLSLPLIGRVSMDTITVDISSIPKNDIEVGNFVEIIGDNFTIDEAARIANTVPHELLSGLGRRHLRLYTKSIRHTI